MPFIISLYLIYTCNDKIVSVDIDSVNSIYFINYILSISIFVKSDIENIKVEQDNIGQIICILFCNTKIKITKPIFEEKRENLVR